jgi:hypothetical protein
MQSRAVVEAADRLEPLPYSQDDGEGKHHDARHYRESGDGTRLGARSSVKCSVTVKQYRADAHKEMPCQRRVSALENVFIALP